jgi:hypothetical protein
MLPRKRTAGPNTPPPPPQQMPPPSSTRAILPRPGARECRGCGVMTELVQGSDYCWDCTYDPPCLCLGPRRPYDDA